MNKARRVDLWQVFEARAQARALLFRAGVYEDSGDAIVPLLVWAHERGLDDATAGAIVNDAFRDAG